MNAKKCKRARALARKLSKGQPAISHVKARGNTRTVINHPKSTRGVYRIIKKGIRMGATVDQIATGAQA